MPTSLRAGRSLAIAALVLLFPVAVARAQQPAPRGAAPVAHGPGEVSGIVVRADNALPIATATVSLAPSGPNTRSVAQVHVKEDGSFRLEGIPAGRYVLRVRSLGYVPAQRSGLVVAADHPVLELGKITLAASATQLGDVTVHAERSDVSLSPDRNSYTVKDMPATSGGTAIDVLRNVPSVEVDGDNNVSLRGDQNVVIQINGRPTPLKGDQLGNFLAQLPAGMVQKVEVVTNPSAKNDPDGTAGIINIVLVQKTDLGTSGGFNATSGTTGLLNVSGNVGRQVGAWTGFASLGIMGDDRTMTGYSDRTNLYLAQPTSVAGDIRGHNVPHSQNGTVRGEYRPREHDAFSFDGVLSHGNYRRDNGSYYETDDPSGAPVSFYDYLSAASSRNLNQDYTVAFRHMVDPQRNAFAAELRFNQNNGGNRNLLTQDLLSSSGAATGTLSAPERDTSSMRMPVWTLQSDWTRALGGGTKLETGVKGIMRRLTSAYDVSQFATDSTTGASGFAANPALSDHFLYHEQVEDVYGVLSQQLGVVQVQGGLRLEQALQRFDATALGARFRNDYRSAFPSALVNWSLSDTRQLKLSYSRRISRPDPWQLDPTISREDALNVREGNPYLRPEYTDSYEIGYQWQLPKGSVQLSPFWRHTANDIRWIRTVDTTGVTTQTFANVSTNDNTGADANVSLRLGRFSVFGGANAYRVVTNASNLVNDPSVHAFGWSARGNGTLKLTSTLDMQGFVMYRAPMPVEYGRMTRFLMTNVAFRQKLRGDAATMTLRISDPFNTMAFGMRTNNGLILQDTERHFGQRGVFLGFSYNFGSQPKFRPQQQQPDQPDPVTQPGAPAGPR